MNQPTLHYIPNHFYELEKAFIYTTFPKVNFKAKMFNLIDFQHGGAEYEKIVKFIDEGGVYTYRVYTNTKHDKKLNQAHIAILTPNDTECVSILVDKNNGTSTLHNMSYYENCALEGLRKPGGGSKLLRFALNLILQFKETYKINKIILTDNSFLYCKGASKNLKLSQLRMITHGETWYAKYGFRPIEIDESTLIENKKVIDGIKTKDNDIIKLIQKDKIKNINVKEISHLIIKYPQIKDFIIRLTYEMDKYCHLLISIMYLLYETPGKPKLINFYGKQFYLDI